VVFVYFGHQLVGLEAVSAVDMRRHKRRCVAFLAAGFAKKTVCEARNASKRV